MTEAYQGLTPPPELVEEWRTAPQYATGSGRIEMVSMRLQRLQEIADKAAQYGADRELEACCEWLRSKDILEPAIDALRAARRPKPPSLKEQAQAELDRLIALITTEGALAMAEPIRRALEQLDD